MLSCAPLTNALQIGSLTVEAWKHPREVSATVVKKVHVAQIRNGAIGDFRSYGIRPKGRLIPGDPRSEIRLFPDDEQEIRERLIDGAKAPASRGRHGYGRTHWLRVATTYASIRQSGFKGDSYAELGRRLGVKRATAHEWAKVARRKGYLLAGGRLGPQALFHYEKPSQT